MYTTEQGIDVAEAADFDAKLGGAAQQQRRRQPDRAPPGRQIARDARGNNRVDDVFGRQRAELEAEREREYQARRQGRGGGMGRRRDEWDDLDRW